MKIFTFMIIALLLFAESALAGMIETLDFSMDYINVGYTTSMAFSFKLDQGLGASAYFSLKLPLTLGTSVVA